jgi:flavin-dependent dehydrogenase
VVFRPALETEVLVLGGGPAGCAAAITARIAGLNVILIEASVQPRRKPGETLHPGIEAVFKQLGVLEQIHAARFHRHRGIWIKWDAPRSFQPYGQDRNGPWLGFQADRIRFETLLLNCAENLGVTLLRPCRATHVLCDKRRVIGLGTARGIVRAHWVVDAGGGQHWLANQLGLTVTQYSPRLIPRFGWVGLPQITESDPSICAHSVGWLWQAPIDDTRIAWCQLGFLSDAQDTPIVDEGQPKIVFGACDVTWRSVSEAAGCGYFMIGDAAAVLDPASSHGVLRAMMSGIKAAHAAVQICRGFSETAATRDFNTWTARWFHHDVNALKALYRRHPNAPSWIAAPEFNPIPYDLRRMQIVHLRSRNDCHRRE